MVIRYPMDSEILHERRVQDARKAEATSSFKTEIDETDVAFQVRELSLLIS